MASIIKYADLHSEYISQKTEIDAAIQRCLDSSNFILGQAVDEFEQAVSERLGCPFVGVASGTSALHLALLALGIGPGDEVIVPSMTFMSTAEMVAQVGATPVFVDINGYYLISLNEVRKKITDKTKAIIVVDLYGQCVDFAQWQEFRQQGIKLIEDAAQSWGINYQGENPHRWVDAQCWSFYPGKNLSAIGDAGGVSGNKDLVDAVRQLSNHGRSAKYLHTHMGWNQRMDSVQAAVLKVKLDRQEWLLTNKQQAAAYYAKRLEGSNATVPKQASWCDHTWNQYMVLVDGRDAVRERMTIKGIETGLQYPRPLHRQPAFNYLKTAKEHFYGCEDIAERGLCLPMHGYLTHKQVDRVCDTIMWFMDDGK